MNWINETGEKDYMALADVISQLGSTIINLVSNTVQGIADFLNDNIGDIPDTGGGSSADNSYNIGGLGDIIYSIEPLPSDKYASFRDNRIVTITTGLLHTKLLEYYNNCPTWTLMELNVNSSYKEYCPRYIWKATIEGEDVYYSANGRYLNDNNSFLEELDHYTESGSTCKICWDPFIIDFYNFPAEVISSAPIFNTAYLYGVDGVQNVFIRYPFCNNYIGDVNLGGTFVSVSFYDDATESGKIFVDLPSNSMNKCYILNCSSDTSKSIRVNYGFTDPGEEVIPVTGARVMELVPSLPTFVLSGDGIGKYTTCTIRMFGDVNCEDSYYKNLYIRIN